MFIISRSQCTTHYTVTCAVQRCVVICTVMLTAVKFTSFIEENNPKLIPSFSIASKYLRNALAPPQTPLGELKRSPDPLAEFQDKGRGIGRELMEKE